MHQYLYAHIAVGYQIQLCSDETWQWTSSCGSSGAGFETASAAHADAWIDAAYRAMSRQTISRTNWLGLSIGEREALIIESFKDDTGFK